MEADLLGKHDAGLMWRSDYLRIRRRWIIAWVILGVMFSFAFGYVFAMRNSGKTDTPQAVKVGLPEELNDLKNKQVIFEALLPARISLKQGVEVADSILMSSKEHRIPIGLILAVIKRESRFDPLAVSSKKALGMMQIRPVTWAEYTRRLDLKVSLMAAFDPITNIRVGVSILRDLHDYYKPRVPEEKLWHYVLSAYATGKNGISRNFTPFQRGYAEDILKSSKHYEMQLTSRETSGGEEAFIDGG
jgi:soluble lytic murein transglycosylase-like protein